MPKNAENNIASPFDITQVFDSQSVTPTPSSVVAVDASDVDCVLNLSVDGSLEFRHSLCHTGDRYEKIRLLAVGGGGCIFLARDRVLGRQLVVKSLRDEFVGNQELVEKFIAEAKLTAQLVHPSIVPSFSLEGDEAGGLHFAMQLVNGVTLKKLLQQCRDGELTDASFGQLRVRLEAFLRVCDAVEYSHCRGIIHCDLKPDNIMLGQHGEVYVMDWGLAYPAGTSRKERISGTPAYMSPEAMTEGITNAQTDVFSLGMILNEVVTLRGPISGKKISDIVARICSGDFEPSTGIDSQYPVSTTLRAIIEKARAMNPAERYASADALAEDIRHWLFDEEVTACPDSLLRKFTRFLYHHRNVAALVLALVVCCSAALAVFGLYRDFMAEENVSFEVLRLTKLLRYTEARAAEIDNQVFRIQEQLKLLGMSIGIEIADPSDSHQADDFYLVSDFASQENKPNDLVMAPSYGREISFFHASCIKPDSMSREQMDYTARRINALHRPIFSLLMSSVLDKDGVALPAEKSKRLFLERGGLVRRVNVCFDDGLTMSFPGMHEDNLDAIQERREREQHQILSQRLQWSRPYTDGTGHSVVACWGTVYDCVGNAIGSIGIEVCFANLVRGLSAQNEREQFKSTYFLLDADGKQLFTTNEEYESCSAFPYPQLLPRLNDSMVFIADVDGKPTRVSWKQISQTGWTLIQLVPRDEVELLDLEFNARARENVKQEIGGE